MTRLETDPGGRRNDVTALIDHAVALFRGGRLAEAKRIARRILADQPKHAQALHLLGVALSQPTWQVRWASHCGCSRCCRRIGAGCLIAPTAPGTRRPDSIGRSGSATGRAWWREFATISFRWRVTSKELRSSMSDTCAMRAQPHSRPGAATASAAASGVIAAPRVLPDSELYRSEASCGGMVLGSGSPPSMAVSQSVGLGMTECEVVRHLGAPNRMELASPAGDQRLLALTYGRGEHPRLYRFAAGRLFAIEALPPPATSARRVR
jgi:hypothetical protein